MQNNEILFKKFDTLPYIIVVVDDKGFIKFKNHYSKSIAENLHIGAKIENYTKVDITKNGIIFGEFYGLDYIIMISDIEIDGTNNKIIVASDMILSKELLPKNPIDFINNKIEIMLTQNNVACSMIEENNNDVKKKHYLNIIRKNSNKVRYFGEFIKLFLNNKSKEFDTTTDVSNISGTIGRVVDRIQNRLDMDFKFNFISKADNAFTDINIKDYLNIILNAMTFCISNSGNSTADIEVFENNNQYIARFSFVNKYDVINLFDNNASKSDTSFLTAYVIFSLSKAIGIETGIWSESFKKNYKTTLEIKFNSSKTSTINFNSSINIEPLIDSAIDFAYSLID